MGDCDTSRCEHGRGLDAGCDVCTPSHAALVARVAELEEAQTRHLELIRDMTWEAANPGRGEG